MTRDELTLKAISTYNGNLYNGLTKALEAVVAMALEEAESVVRRMPSPSSEWMADELRRALGPANPVPAAIRAMIPEEK
jgi:hypothetical protein